MSVAGSGATGPATAVLLVHVIRWWWRAGTTSHAAGFAAGLLRRPLPVARARATAFRCRRRTSVSSYGVLPRHGVERVNAQLKNWRILRKIRSCPSNASKLVAAVQTLMITSA